jgi:hypothetical protein
VPLYVLAITDAEVTLRTGAGKAARVVEIDGMFAVCELRRSVPPPTDRVLRAQHASVVALARRVGAILPVRFGTLLDETALVTRLRAHAPELRRALDGVRGMVQMTTRISGDPPKRSSRSVSTGRAYLEARRLAASPPLPPAARHFLQSVEGLVARERREPGTGRLLAIVYHLVADVDLASYRRRAEAAQAPGLLISGPWPPFAFTPQLF